MFNFKNHMRFISHKRTCLNRCGFTLIETVLAIGLLIILVVIVYQGFVSTIQLSANTSNFEKTGDLAAGYVNKNIASALISAPTPPLYAIHLGIGSYSKNLGVYKFKATPTPSTNYGDAAYKELSPASTNRSGFWYCGHPWA